MPDDLTDLTSYHANPHYNVTYPKRIVESRSTKGRSVSHRSAVIAWIELEVIENWKFQRCWSWILLPWNAKIFKQPVRRLAWRLMARYMLLIGIVS